MSGGKQHFFVLMHFAVAAKGKGLKEFPSVISGEQERTSQSRATITVPYRSRGANRTLALDLPSPTDRHLVARYGN